VGILVTSIVIDQSLGCLVLQKCKESLVNVQLRSFLSDNCLLNKFQSGFRPGHSTITATTLVVNDIVRALDKKLNCVALFVDLSKAFDTVDHSHLLKRLTSLGLASDTCLWFQNYLSD
jgi:hypothetical protein